MPQTDGRLQYQATQVVNNVEWDGNMIRGGEWEDAVVACLRILISDVPKISK